MAKAKKIVSPVKKQVTLKKSAALTKTPKKVIVKPANKKSVAHVTADKSTKDKKVKVSVAKKVDNTPPWEDSKKVKAAVTPPKRPVGRPSTKKKEEPVINAKDDVAAMAARASSPIIRKEPLLLHRPGIEVSRLVTPTEEAIAGTTSDKLSFGTSFGGSVQPSLNAPKAVAQPTGDKISLSSVTRGLEAMSHGQPTSFPAFRTRS